MKSIEVKYFALLREQAGIESEKLLIDVQTYGDLYQELVLKYHFTLPASMIQVAVNDEFTSMQNEINHGVKVVFIPPVAGG